MVKIKQLHERVLQQRHKDNCKLCISKHAQQAQTRTPLQSYKIVIKC